MRIILSRKGFDTSSGGGPSPILPDGTLVSLPIPDRCSGIRYRDIGCPLGHLGHLVPSLSRQRIRGTHTAHLDPDLRTDALPRLAGWRPLFGQTGAAQSHLQRQGVGPGDVFLFFGLFRAVTRVGRHWRWAPGSRPLHQLWGWLQVGTCHTVDAIPPQAMPWARYHPHFSRAPDSRNTLYVASPRLTALPDCDAHPGGGVFGTHAAHRQLTADDSGRPSLWRLPAWCRPRGGMMPLTYHGNAIRWQPRNDHVLLQSAARGQEFVLDTAHYPEARAWAARLFRHGT